MFDDLLDANRRYSTSAPRNFDGYAHAGVAIVTCMDSRLQPLEMLGLFLGEAKILRTPGGHVTTFLRDEEPERRAIDFLDRSL